MATDTDGDVVFLFVNDADEFVLLEEEKNKTFSRNNIVVIWDKSKNKF